MTIVVSRHPRKIAVLADRRDVGQHLGQCASLGPSQHLLKNGAVFRFCAVPASGGALFQRIDQRWIEIAYQ